MLHLLNRVNRGEYDHALTHLGAKPRETVLELGFGGGVGVAALLNSGANVVAAEPSVAMRAAAHRKFARALAEERLEVWSNSAETLPDRTVDRALSLNTVYFWQDIDQGFANLARMVRTRIVLGIATPEHLRQAGFDQEGYRVEPVTWYEARLQAVGFESRIVPLPNGIASLLIGETKDSE